MQNHDTERNGDALNYKDGATNSWPRSTSSPRATAARRSTRRSSSTTNDDSPPATADGLITDTDCSAGWACTDRDAGVDGAGALAQRRGCRRRSANWRDDGANVISFRRGNRGWVAFNNDPAPHTVTVQTGLPSGHATATWSPAAARLGHQVSVDRSGAATVTVPAKGAVAVLR